MLLVLDYEIDCVRIFFISTFDWAMYGAEDGLECTRIEELVDRVVCRITYVTSFGVGLMTSMLKLMYQFCCNLVCVIGKCD